jgi:hypothetical protein
MPLNEHLKLNVCECGHLHLTYKSMTLHFEKEEFLNYTAHLVQMAAQVSSPAHLHQAMSFADGKNTSCH